MADFERPLHSSGKTPQAGGGAGQRDQEWLKYCELRRELLILELRQVEGVLIAAGRLKRPSLPAARRDY